MCEPWDLFSAAVLVGCPIGFLVGAMLAKWIMTKAYGPFPKR